MSKVFIIATPLSLLVAQQIVRQEKIEDAILWESWVEPNSQFLKTYDLCIIPTLWKKRLPPVGGFPGWDYSGVRLAHTARKTWNRYKKIKQVLEENQVDEIFLANYQEETYRFMTVVFTHLGYKVSFYEEGSSNYVQLPYHINHGPVALLKEWGLDVLYYLPLYHVRFAYWRNNPNRPTDGLPIHRRFSIVPGILHEPYDIQLKCEHMMSENLKAYLKKVVGQVADGKKMLLLTEPMDNVLPSPYLHAYYDTIADALDDLGTDFQLFVKPHPREKKELQLETIKLLHDKSIPYQMLSTDINVPVEYILEYIHFDEILVFNASTFFYNGYLFPKSHFRVLLRPFLKKCKQAGAPAYSLDVVKGWIEKMNRLQAL